MTVWLESDGSPATNSSQEGRQIYREKQTGRLTDRQNTHPAAEGTESLAVSAELRRCSGSAPRGQS